MSTAIELLAPARDLECGLAAIDAGADAVYIGGPAFGARVNAGNSIDDIARLCDYAHQFRSKIHVTLNTILSDQELSEALVLIDDLYRVGVDALIIQDLGLLQYNLPPLELHASTQQNNANADKVKFLQDLGFSQAVLARELSLDDIRQIHQDVPAMRLEFFVHGALCASVSGRCYLSQCVTGRSANRGECAQLCRVPMSLRTQKGEYLAQDRYLLSLRDLNNTANLAQLLEAGVSSFKIEGRLKDVGYVRNVTAWYRRALDHILEHSTDYFRSSYGASSYQFEPDVAKSFNRGFTDYNLHGRRENFANFESPKVIGQPAAQVTAVQGRIIRVKLKPAVELHNGDKCNFFVGSEMRGFRISRVDGNSLEVFEPVRDLSRGMILYRNKDADFERIVQKSQSCQRHLALDLTYRETPTGFIIQGQDETGDSARVEFTQSDLPPAQHPQGQLENIKKQLSRIGDTIFSLRQLQVECDFGWFVQVKILNSYRNRLLEQLLQLKKSPCRSAQLPKRCQAAVTLPRDEQNLGYQANIYNQQSRAFYLEHGACNVTMAYEIQKQPRAVLMYCKHCLRYCFGMCEKYNLKRSPEPLELVIGSRVFKLEFDCKHCQMLVLDHSRSDDHRE